MWHLQAESEHPSADFDDDEDATAAPGTSAALLSGQRHGDAVDVVLHVYGCAFALTQAVLATRCPALHTRMERLRLVHSYAALYADKSTLPVSLEPNKLWLVDADRSRSSPWFISAPCPLTGRSISHQQRMRDNNEEDKENQGDDCSGYYIFAQCLNHNNDSGLINSQPLSEYQISLESLDVLHVELVLPSEPPTAVRSVASLLEFLYMDRIVLAEEDSDAQQVLQLCKLVQLENLLTAACFRALIRRVTLDTWINLLLQIRKVRNEAQRLILLDHLLDMLRNPTREQCELMLQDDLFPMQRFTEIKDREVMLYVVAFFINHVRHFGIWHRLMLVLEMWMLRRAATRHYVLTTPSLMSIVELHRQFAPWTPVVVIHTTQLAERRYDNDRHPIPETLFMFGEYLFQVRLDARSLTLIYWRVIKASSPYSSVDAEEPEENWALDQHSKQPVFTIRGLICIRYKSSSHGRVLQNIEDIQYTHCHEEYGKWKQLVVGASPSAVPVADFSDSPPAPKNDDSEDHEQRRMKGDAEDESSDLFADESLSAQFTGQLFVWGHRLCTLYHFLLASTLFNTSAVANMSEEAIILRAVSEMQRLPTETLVTVLPSDRLRVPGGETMLVKALTLLCFGTNSDSDSECSQELCFQSQPRETPALVTRNYSVEETTAFFRCVRWSFCEMRQVIRTLRISPRSYFFYELIVRGLKERHLLLPRRAPWQREGERKRTFHATTTLAEFLIEAGDSALSPESVQRKKLRKGSLT